MPRAASPALAPVARPAAPAADALPTSPAVWRVAVDRIASATAGRLRSRKVEVLSGGAVRAGDIVIVEALEEKQVYDKLELATGRLVHIGPGDVLAGTLGARAALKGFVGHCPDIVHAGDELHLLNLGGVIGVATSGTRDVGAALRVRVVGLAVERGRPLNIRTGAVPPAQHLACAVPVVLVAGTCMAAGKTEAACAIISGLARRGLTLGAVKLSGVARLRDLLDMADHGAACGLSFLDAGYPSTAGLDDLAPMAKGLLNAVAAKGVDAIVVEMGDGIIGGYAVQSYYHDRELRAATTVHVMCANDLVAAWGAKELTARLGCRVDILCGPATDNEVGERYVEDELGIPAANARTSGDRLAALVARHLVS